METPCLTTERLLLRPFKKEDAEDLYRWTSSIRCTEYLFWHPNRSLEDAQRILARWVDKPRQYAWALELNGHAVGEINVIKTLPDKGYEIGYILRDDLWGHGYMSEAFKAVLTFMWNQGYRYVYAETHSENLRSRHLLEKMGFQLTGIEKGRFIGKIDQTIDVAQYRLQSR
jgi:ribosomal-protein-alanine N-acetyltransferase